MHDDHQKNNAHKKLTFTFTCTQARVKGITITITTRQHTEGKKMLAHLNVYIQVLEIES